MDFSPLIDQYGFAAGLALGVAAAAIALVRNAARRGRRR
jgi:hypothetical protein